MYAYTALANVQLSAAVSPPPGAVQRGRMLLFLAIAFGISALFN